jgi:hypothetical protein
MYFFVVVVVVVVAGKLESTDGWTTLEDGFDDWRKTFILGKLYIASSLVITPQAVLCHGTTKAQQQQLTHFSCCQYC